LKNKKFAKLPDIHRGRHRPLLRCVLWVPNQYSSAWRQISCQWSVCWFRLLTIVYLLPTWSITKKKNKKKLICVIIWKEFSY